MLMICRRTFVLGLLLGVLFSYGCKTDSCSGCANVMLSPSTNKADAEKIIQEYGVDAVGREGVTLLMKLLASGPTPDAGAVQAFIDAGAAVNAKDDYGTTALMIAVTQNQNTDIVKLLLKAGADFNAMKNMDSVLSLAAQYNTNPEIIKELLQAGVDPKTEQNKNAVSNAAQLNSNPEVLKLLVDSGADINIRGVFNTTPLMNAAMSNQNPEMIKTMLKLGADINAKDEYDFTAILYAARNNYNPEVFKVLAGAGAEFMPEKLLESSRQNTNPEVLAAVEGFLSKK